MRNLLHKQKEMGRFTISQWIYYRSKISKKKTILIRYRFSAERIYSFAICTFLPILFQFETKQLAVGLFSLLARAETSSKLYVSILASTSRTLEKL